MDTTDSTDSKNTITDLDKNLIIQGLRKNLISPKMVRDAMKELDDSKITNSNKESNITPDTTIQSKTNEDSAVVVSNEKSKSQLNLIDNQYNELEKLLQDLNIDIDKLTNPNEIIKTDDQKNSYITENLNNIDENLNTADLVADSLFSSDSASTTSLESIGIKHRAVFEINSLLAKDVYKSIRDNDVKKRFISEIMKNKSENCDYINEDTCSLKNSPNMSKCTKMINSLHNACHLFNRFWINIVTCGSCCKRKSKNKEEKINDKTECDEKNIQKNITKV